MTQERIPLIRGLADAGLSIGAIITQETVRGTWKLTSGIVRFAGRQTLQSIQRVVDITDAHSHALSQTRQQEIGHDLSRDEARDNFILAMVRNPKDTDLIGQHFEVLDAKLKGITDVSDGVRTKDGPDGVVPIEIITRSFLTESYVNQVAALTTELGVDGEAASSWLERLRTYSDQEAPEPSSLPEQRVPLTPYNARESSPLTV